MKFVLALLALVALFINIESQLFHDTSIPDHIAFDSFQEHFKRHYHPREKSKRFALFKESRRRIHSMNEKYKLGLITFTSRINHFSDLTREELIARTVGSMEIPREEPTAVVDSQDLIEHNRRKRQAPDAYNWATSGNVIPVQDQGWCGSGYTFAATAVLSTFAANKCPNGLIIFSSQALVDCSGPQKNRNCTAGKAEQCYDYFKTLSSVPVMNNYLYTSGTNGDVGPCKYTTSMPSKVQVLGYVTVPSGEDNLKTAVATIGPICSYVNVNHTSFFDMGTTGVWSDPACTNLTGKSDHYMMVIGYGTNSAGVPFWIFQNSWGTTVGNSGMWKILRNNNNMCCVACTMCYPTIKCLP